MRDGQVVERALAVAFEENLQRPLKLFLRGEALPETLEETRSVLVEFARRKCGHLDPERLVEQVLAVTEGTDWPCRKGALDAILRRIASAERDELRIVARPPRGRILGCYGLAGKRPGSEGAGRRKQRPYKTELLGVAPYRGSCDCADFLRGSLGLCKHLVAVLEDVSKNEPKLARARAEQSQPAMSSQVRLAWNPIRPWTGDGDRLAGLRLEGPVSRTARSVARAFSSEGSPSKEWLRNNDQRRSTLTAITSSLLEGKLAADSGTRALVQEELERVQRELEAAASARRALGSLKTLKRKLYPYQHESVARFFSQGRLLLADDMGLGKTVQAIAACHGLFHAERVARGLLLVPASLKSQWVREWNATSDVPIQIVEGRPDEREKILRTVRKGFLVMNYEQLLRDLPAVHRFAPQMVVLDEAQRIKNWATKSYAYVQTLAPEFRIVLTGTPMENRLEELATILDWVDDVALTPKWRLAPWHMRMEGAGGGRSGARNLGTLRERIKPCVLRRIRHEVLTQLPPRTDTRVPVEMTEQQRAEHDALSSPIASLVQRAHKRPLTQPEFLKLMQLLTQQRIISNGLAQLNFREMWPLYSNSRADDVLLQGACSPKLAEARRLITELAVEQGRKIVVFSQWRSMLRLAGWAVRDVLEDQGLRAVYFTGAESQKVRTKNVIDFHDEPDVRVMFLSDAGGVGLNLQRAASACINLELPWNPAVLEQRIGRIYRLGQTLPIDVYNLVSDYGIESRIADIVGTKRALFVGLFDGTSDEVRFEVEGGFLSEVERLIEPAAVPAWTAGSDIETRSDEDALDDLPVQSAIHPVADKSMEEEVLSSPLDHRADQGSAEQALPAVVDAAPAAIAPAVVDAAPAAIAPAVVDTAALEAGSWEGPIGAGEAAPAPGDDGNSVDAAGASPTAGLPGITSVPSLVGTLLQQIQLTRSADGGFRLEAPPAAARELATLATGLLKMLAAVAE